VNVVNDPFLERTSAVTGAKPAAGFAYESTALFADSDLPPWIEINWIRFEISRPIIASLDY
jgi:hypothetical protein